MGKGVLQISARWYDARPCSIRCRWVPESGRTREGSGRISGMDERDDSDPLATVGGHGMAGAKNTHSNPIRSVVGFRV